MPTPEHPLSEYKVGQTVVRYGSLVGSLVGTRQQDTLVFIDDPTKQWEDAANTTGVPPWKVDPVSGKKIWPSYPGGPEVVVLPELTTGGAGVSWSGCDDISCFHRNYASAALDSTDYHMYCPSGACAFDTLTKWYFTFDRGACSKRYPAGEIMQKLVNLATQAMHDQVADQDPGLASTESYQYARAQTGIWQAAGLDAEGGFQVNLEMSVSTTGIVWKGPWYAKIPLYIDYEAYANVIGRYQWVIDDDGVVGVARLGEQTVGATPGDVKPDYVPGIYKLPLDAKLRDGLATQIPEQVRAVALDKQLQEIKGINKKPVGCATAAECATSAAAGTLLFGIGLARQHNVITDQEHATLSAFVQSPAAWRCDETSKTCKILAAATRINVYPDSIELVFREAGESFPPSTGSVLEVALRGLELAGLSTPETNLSLICDPPTHGQKLIMDFQRKTQSSSYD